MNIPAEKWRVCVQGRGFSEGSRLLFDLESAASRSPAPNSPERPDRLPSPSAPANQPESALGCTFLILGKCHREIKTPAFIRERAPPLGTIARRPHSHAISGIGSELCPLVNFPACSLITFPFLLDSGACEASLSLGRLSQFSTPDFRLRTAPPALTLSRRRCSLKTLFVYF